MKVLAGIVIGALLMGAAVSNINCADVWKNYYCAVKTPWSFTLFKTP